MSKPTTPIQTHIFKTKLDTENAALVVTTAPSIVTTSTAASAPTMVASPTSKVAPEPGSIAEFANTIVEELENIQTRLVGGTKIKQHDSDFITPNTMSAASEQQEGNQNLLLTLQRMISLIKATPTTQSLTEEEFQQIKKFQTNDVASLYDQYFQSSNKTSKLNATTLLYAITGLTKKLNEDIDTLLTKLIIVERTAQQPKTLHFSFNVAAASGIGWEKQAQDLLELFPKILMPAVSSNELAYANISTTLPAPVIMSSTPTAAYGGFLTVYKQAIQSVQEKGYITEAEINQLQVRTGVIALDIKITAFLKAAPRLTSAGYNLALNQKTLPQDSCCKIL